MKKANTLPATPAPFTLSDTDIAHVATYLTDQSDQERSQLERQILQREEAINDNNNEIVRLRRGIAECEEYSARYSKENEEATKKLAEMPPPVPVDAAIAKADMERATALPFIKSIDFMSIDNGARMKPYIVATTRANTLHTMLDRKFSRAERWYKAKPYAIPLPAYKIRIALSGSYSTLSNSDSGLAIALANASEDTSHFLEWIGIYSQEVHPHWGTREANNYSDFRGVCLGEYESEITNAFKKSIAEGLIAFSLYLQMAGSQHAYVSRRENWALWLGKAEYNALMVPSEKEVKTLTLDTEYEPGDCGCYENGRDDDSTCDDDCECDCHN